MDGRDFSLRLKKIKAEVLAMKQGHTYGLSRTNFSYGIAQIETQTSYLKFKLTIVFDTNLDDEPFFIYSNDVNQIDSRTWNPANKTTVIIGKDYSTLGEYSLSAVSAAIIKSMTLEEI